MSEQKPFSNGVSKQFADWDSLSRANFATSSRVLSCLVTESLVKALYIPSLQDIKIKGLAVIFILSDQVPDLITEAGSILAVLPLKHVPVFKNSAKGIFREIGLLDPMDMFPGLVFEFADHASGNDESQVDFREAILRILQTSGLRLPTNQTLTLNQNALDLWTRYARAHGVDEKLENAISEEFKSSVQWQAYSFENPPKAPSWDSKPIDWEQSIVEGHPTHPMHKTRMFLPPIPLIAPGEYDLYHAKIRFVGLPRGALKLSGDFEGEVEPVVQAGIAAAGGRPFGVSEELVIIPVHELQVGHIQDKFVEAVIFGEEYSLPILGQQSIRSVILPDVLKTTHLKLGVGIKLTSAVRTISPHSAFLGPRLCELVLPHLTYDRKILTVARELASVVHKHEDVEIAKHCAVIVRESHELSPRDDERMIVCTALVEKGHQGEGGENYALLRVFELDTEEKRVAWLDSFIRLFFRAFLPPMLINGLGFEAHPQNVIARFHPETKEVTGFIVRDFGGIRIHPPTLLATTGVKIQDVVLPGHSILGEDLEDVYTRMYHTIIHNHFQQLIRVLGLHYSGVGWEIVRRHLEEQIPQGHGLRKIWLEEETVLGKCFMRMRMQGMYRFHLHGPFPNLILYQGEDKEEQGLPN